MSARPEIAETRNIRLTPEIDTREGLIDVVNNVYRSFAMESLPLEEKLANGDSLTEEEKQILTGYRITTKGIKLVTRHGEPSLKNPLSYDLTADYFFLYFPNPYAQRGDPESYATMEGISGEYFKDHLNRKKEIFRKTGEYAQRTETVQSLEQEIRICESQIALIDRNCTPLGASILDPKMKKARVAYEAKLISLDPLRANTESSNDQENRDNNWYDGEQAVDNRLILGFPSKRASTPKATPNKNNPGCLSTAPGCLLASYWLISEAYSSIKAGLNDFGREKTTTPGIGLGYRTGLSEGNPGCSGALGSGLISLADLPIRGGLGILKGTRDTAGDFYINIREIGDDLGELGRYSKDKSKAVWGGIKDKGGHLRKLLDDKRERDLWGVYYMPPRIVRDRELPTTPSVEDQREEDKGRKRWGCLGKSLALLAIVAFLSTLRSCEDGRNNQLLLEPTDPNRSLWGDYLGNFASFNDAEIATIETHITGQPVPVELKEAWTAVSKYTGPIDAANETINAAVIGTVDHLGVRIVYTGFDWYKSEIKAKIANPLTKIDERFDNKREFIDGVPGSSTPTRQQFMTALEKAAKQP